MSLPPFAVIIAAAGKSERFSKDGVKKEFLSVDGETVLFRATAPFLSIPNCKMVVVVCPKGLENECGIALGDLYEHQSIPVILCDGGTSREESVFNGLKLLKNLGIPVQYVAIHDGARCFITTDLIIQTLATATIFGGAAPALPPTDSLKTITDEGVVTGHIPRHGTVGIQTPQFFRWPDIYLAHEKVRETANRTRMTRKSLRKRDTGSECAKGTGIIEKSPIWKRSPMPRSKSIRIGKPGRKE